MHSNFQCCFFLDEWAYLMAFAKSNMNTQSNSDDIDPFVFLSAVQPTTSTEGSSTLMRCGHTNSFIVQINRRIAFIYN